MKNHLVPALLASSLLLSACSWLPESDPPAAAPEIQSFTFLRLAPTPPPAPQEEVRPEPTEPINQIWRKGYWSFDGQTYTWNPGTYMRRPFPTADWSPDRWEKRSYGWAFIPGYWY